MVPPEPRMISVSLTAVPLSTQAQVPAEAPCLGCGSSLELHQPDGNAPQRLLGTCDSCGAWNLIDCDRALMVLLPDTDRFDNAEADG
jgi:hypothetical protein